MGLWICRPRWFPGCVFASVFLLVFLLARAATAQNSTQATTVPLILPGGLAYSVGGDLYFVEAGRHLVRKVSNGVISTVVGTGVQGFDGDGGAATAALLDSPSALAFDSSQNLIVADAGNHRLRRVDAVTGTISTIAGAGPAGASPSGTAATASMLGKPVALAVGSDGGIYFADQTADLILRLNPVSGMLTTVAGTGVQGAGGDGGPALKADLDSPGGLAVDAKGNVYLADTHNHRIREVEKATGLIRTVSGTGVFGFAGDGSAASSGRFALPAGLALDTQGNLYIADSANQRVRRWNAASGQLETVAGDGVQAYAGDGNPAVAASLDSPRTVAVSPDSLATIADAGNARVRQVDGSAAIHTIAGLGATTAATLLLSAKSVLLYGTGSLTATLAASSASGTVTFFDAGQTLIAATLTGNRAQLDTSSLGAGLHAIAATYAGDATHAAARSDTFGLTIAPVAVTVTPNAVQTVYGQAVPALTGAVTGVLTRDAAAAQLQLTSGASALSSAGVYPIRASLVGAAAANYSVTLVPANVTVSRAAPSVSLTQALAVHVATPTRGVPGGTVRLLDGSSPVQSQVLDGVGGASFDLAALANGSHTLTAAYLGDGNFLAESSAPVMVTTSAADFALASSGPAALTVTSGSTAAFQFVASPVNGSLASAIQLTASGLPPGATAAFNPQYLPPSAAATTFTLTVQTLKAADQRPPVPWVLALFVPLLWARGRCRVRTLAAGLVLVMSTAGCGDRVVTLAKNGSGKTYPIVVTATATSVSGTLLQHAVTVSLSVP